MLETDDSTTEGANPSAISPGAISPGATGSAASTDAQPAKRAPRKRQPRKAAVPPSTDPAASTEPGSSTDSAPDGSAGAALSLPAAPAALAPAKRAPRKATRKSAPAGAASDSLADLSADSPPSASSSRTPELVAPAGVSQPINAVEQVAVDQVAVEQVVVKQAKATKRVSKKAVPAVASAVVASEPAPAPDGAVPDAAPAAPPARSRRRKPAASLAADADPLADPDSSGEPVESGPDHAASPVLAAPSALFLTPSERPARKRQPRRAQSASPEPATLSEHELGAGDPDLDPTDLEPTDTDLTGDLDELEEAEESTEELRDAAAEEAAGARRRRRRGRRGRGRARDETEAVTEPDGDDEPQSDSEPDVEAIAVDDGPGDDGSTARRRRRRRRSGNGDSDGSPVDDPPNTVVHVRDRRAEGADDDGVRGVKGSTRLEAKRQRRRDGRDSGRRRPAILSESEFLARRESVDRVMAVRQAGDRTEIAVLEDDVLVEHHVTRESATSYVGNVYLGRVQNVLPSMEAAFIDIGKGRNGVLYAGEVNWDAAGLEGKSRSIEQALHSGDPVLVQVTKDPIGHKGARLTSQISLPGRFLVYVPGGGMTGISRRLPDTERARLKSILKKIVPEDAGVIIRTAAEGATEEEITHDVERLKAEWESISAKAEQRKAAPVLVHGEPDLAIRVVRDVFNEDFRSLIVQGEEAWATISGYLSDVAPDLAERASRYIPDSDLFHDLRVDEGLAKALDRKVFLPSGGSLVIDRTEAMTVIDVNTGKFVGSGGNLEQTVTRNNLEAAEEIVRQLRLRDVGGIVVIDFIDMVLESNRELVLRRLTECLSRDRTKHQVAEVSSLGLVQMTRKRVGEGLLEAFSEPCPTCKGRGVILHAHPVEQQPHEELFEDDRPARRRSGRRGATTKAEPVVIDVEPMNDEQRKAAAEAMAAIHRAAAEGEELPVALAEATAAFEDATQVLRAEIDLIVELGGTAPNGNRAEAELDAPQPDAPQSDEVTFAAVKAPGRRRRGASRPAGPPVPTD